MAIDLPPAQYDHPFPGYQVVEVVDYWKVDEACRLRGAQLTGERIAGCATRFIRNGAWACHIVYPRLDSASMDVDTMVMIIRHETAHCNGWPANHPDGHYE